MFTGHIVALPTPFKNQNLDLHALKNLVLHHIEAGVDGLVILGTTGERSALTQDEQTLVIQTVLRLAKGKLPIIVNTGCNSTSKSIAATQEAKRLGADGCLVVLPYYNKPPLRGIIAHFEAISKVGLPIIAYHHPGRTGIALNADAWTKILRIPNIVALKEASGDLELVKALARITNVLCGDDHLTSQMMALGAKGTISVIGNLIPKLWSLDLVNQQPSCQPLLDALSLDVNPIPVKCGLEILGLTTSEVRLPLMPAEDETKQALKAALDLTLCAK